LGANRTVSTFNARLAPGSVPPPGRYVPTKSELPPPVVTGAPTFTDHATTGTSAATANTAPRRPSSMAITGISTSRFARVSTAAASSSPATAYFLRASASSAAVSHNAPSGSESNSPVAPISGGYVATTPAATSPATTTRGGAAERGAAAPRGAADNGAAAPRGAADNGAAAPRGAADNGAAAPRGAAARGRTAWAVATASAKTSGIRAVPASHWTQ
jgi:hypothetical protein